MLLSSLHSHLFHSKNDRTLRAWRNQAARIHEHETSYTSLAEEAIAQQSQAWRERLSAIADHAPLSEALSALAPQAFALALQVSRRLCGQELTLQGETRLWDMVFHDVQLMGGLAMLEGNIAEMGTGEGKTLTATLPAYLTALAGRGVHIVTVNDYLAQRDAEWMGHLFNRLGLTVGCLSPGQNPAARRAAYHCDIVYGTASEFGFDYLRDHSVTQDVSEQVQRRPYFAMIDEIDSILIDEARTPLVISGPATHDRSEAYRSMRDPIDRLVQRQHHECLQLIKDARIHLGAGEESEAAALLFQTQLAMPKHPALRKLIEDPRMLRLLEREKVAMHMDHRRAELSAVKETLYFSQDPRRHQVELSERGCRFLSPHDPNAFVLPEWAMDEADQPTWQKRAARIHASCQLLRAFTLYERDQDYQLDNGRIEIVDREQGRLMEGRRWNDGLHQAIEAKERVRIEPETTTLATITLQNYFRLYPKLAGMTGTALPEAEEFAEVFGLGVTAIPSHKPCIRVDAEDRIFLTQRDKLVAVVDEIAKTHAIGQPVLVGTPHVERSEVLSRMLRRKGIPHRVLNAKRPAEEADIIARAGNRGAVTVSTNMAGRGTDIRLADGITALGGLYVIGTERHPSSRVDLQLRGRSARQGDPGLTRFFVSLEDELFKRFDHSDRLTNWLTRMGHPDGSPLEHPMLSRTLAQAQKQLEAHHSKIRRLTLKYDDVLQAQRSEIYAWRQDILTSAPRELIADLISQIEDSDQEEPWQTHQERWAEVDPALVEFVERQALLKALTSAWCDHLERLEALKEDANFEALAQRDPLLEYRRHAFEQFGKLESQLRDSSLSQVFSLRPPSPEPPLMNREEGPRILLEVKPNENVGRNVSCPCGSGLKYKHCCLEPSRPEPAA